MKRQWRKIVILILALILLASLTSCDLFTNESNTDEIKVPKPEFKVALDNYTTLNAKSSEFEGKVVISLYGRVSEKTGNPITYSVGERVSLKRIQNGGKIYVDGTIGNESDSSTTTMEALLKAVKSELPALKLPQNINDIINSIIGFLDGTQSAQFLLGYDNANTSYNFKGNLKNDNKTKSIYYATNNEFLMNELLKKSINTSINFNDYLMFSTFVDFRSGSGWISKDDASGFYDNVKELCNYQMSASNQKVYAYVMGLFEDFIDSLDIEEYKANIEKYNEALDIIKNWVTVGESNITASVNKNNLPVRMQTSTRININIEIFELEEVLYKIYSDEIIVDNIIKSIKGVFALIMGSNKINMSIDLSFDESFKYDEESVNLLTVDQDLFIDAKEEKKGRVSYINENLEKEPAPDTDE